MKEASCQCSLLLLLYSLLLAEPALSQSLCEPPPNSVVTTTNTSTPSFEMSCMVPPHLVLDAITNTTWQWNKLTADNMVEEALTAITSTSPEASLYMLSVECSRGGFYEAMYTAPNGSCLHVCLFIVEVEEVRMAVIQGVFNNYPVATFSSESILSEGVGQPSMSLEAGNRTTVSVGTCSSIFFSGLGGCLLGVSGTWYKDRMVLDPQSDPTNYQVSSSGELRILSLGESTVGDYVCVTTLPMDLGSYITTAVGIALLPTPSTTEPLATMTTDPADTTGVPTVSGALRDWEIGLIVANVIVVIILVVLVMVGMAWFVVRRKERPVRKDSLLMESRQRPVSMVEQIQQMEEETEEVDFVGPVEVPFSSILFEELVHKGTFKVVHHAVVNYPEQGIMSLPVAVKRLKDDKSELGMEELMGEAYTLRAIHNKAGSHSNVVSMVGVTTQDGPTCLLLEFVPHGRLDNFLLSLKDGPVPEWYIRHFKSTSKIPYHKQMSADLMGVLLQVAEGMTFLTDHGFIHRDLSTRTVLIGDRLNVKVSDPGMIHEGYYYVVTEREHYLQDIAPECLWEKRYSIWSDVWSYGILAYKVITMETVPFPDATVSDMYDKMVGGDRPQLLASFSNEMYFLLQRCWQFTATERPSFSNIVSDLKDMAEKPTKHIILNVAKEPQRGYISDTGQVFLHPLPSYIDNPSKATKKNWRNSATQQSVISSVNDTMYTRDTAETVLDTQSESDNYEGYLRGDLPSWNQEKSSLSSEGEGELATPKLQESKGTRVWVESAGSKVYVETTSLASDEDSRSEAVTIKKKKKKRGKERTTKKGIINPMGVRTNKSSEQAGNTNANNNQGVWHKEEGSGSTNDPPSVTEEDETNCSVAKTSDQSNSSRLLSNSREEIIEL